MTTDFDAAQAVAEVTRQLKVKYPDRPEQELREVATQEVEYLHDRPVLDYVTVLAARAARKRLKRAEATDIQ